MISIIVCTYNRDKYLGDTLNYLAANRYEGEWEIVLVNNNSTDKTHAICMAFQEANRAIPFRYFIEKNQGLSHARNRGMKEAGSQDGRTRQASDWLVFLDDDAFVGEKYLEQLAAYIRQYDNMQAFGGRIFPFFEEGQAPAWLCRWNRSWLSALDKGDAVVEFTGNDYPIGANMGFRRGIADACGEFDTTLGRTGKNLIGGEEKDYFNRIKARQARILYLPNIPVQHCIPPSRTTYDYICRLGAGVGMSEKARTQSKGVGAYMKRLLAEGIKWCATMVLWLNYALIGKAECGKSLVIFRAEVTKNLL